MIFIINLLQNSHSKQHLCRYGTATSSPSCQITTIKPKPVTNSRWRRVVFKISGGALAGSGSSSVDPKVHL